MESAAPDWFYLKLYIGEAIDRMDGLVIRVGKALSEIEGLDSWFFIRYVDESGFHVRLRVRPRADSYSGVRPGVDKICADALGRLHEFVPSTYYPMVVPPGLEELSRQGSVAHNDVTLVEAQYVPEADKYGGASGVQAAESLFNASSELAVRILSEEAQGLYSRKTVVPLLMAECFRVFPSKAGAGAFWRQYSLYWLGGDIPAADDWRTKFFQKGLSLAEERVEVCPALGALPIALQDCLRDWRRALEAAARRYRELGSEAETAPEVLCFNFAHLMNNRLGLSGLEETYMAALLEQRASRTGTPVGFQTNRGDRPEDALQGAAVQTMSSVAPTASRDVDSRDVDLEMPL